MYSMLTRSQRISHENLRLRDKGWLEGFERWFDAKAGVHALPLAVPPMFTPYTARSVTLKNRVVVSPMAQYCCVDGVPDEFHLVHLGSRALGGAGMVVAEMTCPSPDARITPGCPGLWNDAQARAWKRIVDFVHRESDAKIAMQIGHAGAKGSTNEPWDGAGADQPLQAGNWPLIAASPVPYLDDGGAMPKAMDARRHGSRDRRLRARGSLRRRSRLRLARAALRARLPAVELHLAAHQPAQRRLRRQPRQPAALSARGVRGGARGVARSSCRCRCASRRTTGSRVASRRAMRCRSRAPSRRPAPT